MARPRDTKYDAYARHRVLHRLLELFPRYGSWDGMARAISDQRGIPFHRTDLNRIRNKTAGDHILDSVVNWLVMLDADFRSKLSPETIFADVGTSARDYYFHLFGMENLDAWDESLLREYEGVYLCAPEYDPHSYLPSPYVRACQEKQIELPKEWQLRRSMDLKIYLSKRSYLMLKRTSAHYFHAAEIPMAALFPPEFQTGDVKLFHEGVGIASSNTIHVFLRDCLTRVPKIHSIVIRPKDSYRISEVSQCSLYAPTNIRHMVDEWKSLSPEMAAHMREEFRLQNEAEIFIRGSSQINVSPVPLNRNHVDTVFSEDQVYHRKPEDFLESRAVHFIRPDIAIAPQIEKLIDNPLLIGELL